MMILISFLICFFASIIVCSILINKNNKTNHDYGIDALICRQISQRKKANRKK